MKRFKKIWILLGVLLIACGAAFAVSKYEEKKEKIKNSNEIILNISGDDATAISWEYESVKLAFHKDENWIYNDDENFPVSEEMISSLLGEFKEFEASFIIEDVEDFGQYGLDNPQCTINVETTDKSYEIRLGDYSKMDSLRYVSIGDGKVYLAADDPLNMFKITLSDMIDNDNIPSLSNARTIRFEGLENYEVTYMAESSTYCESDKYYTDADGENRPLDSTKVSNYLSRITNLGLDNYATYNASDEELSKYGLDNPELTLTVEYISGSTAAIAEDEEDEASTDTFVLSISMDPEYSGNDDEATAYVRVGESKIIYEITSDTYENITKVAYDDLRHSELFTASFDIVNRIDISLDGADYTITSKDTDDGRSYYYDEEELNVSTLKTALTALKSDEFTDKQPLEKEEIGLTIHLDNENCPEVSIVLYRYDGSSCLAVVDGTPVSFVSRTLMVDLVEAVNAIVLN
ncbi:MAG: DUF4340 domain-containing protein [Butyrivibrio sp.]